MGQGLALGLDRAGRPVRLLGRSARDALAPLAVTPPPWTEATRAAALVIVAVPDDAIPVVAEQLAETRAVGPDQVVLHLSGPLDRDALGPLSRCGAALGSFHPLQTIADPASAPDRLQGAYAAVEGDARAVAAGEALGRTLGMQPFRIAGSAKPAYHAAAVMAGNYPVVLAGVAARIAREAGVPDELAGKIYLPLLAGAVANIERLGPVKALTGPVRRGDARTIMAHLAALEGDDLELYRLLGLAAVEVARVAGLPADQARQIGALLRDEP